MESTFASYAAPLKPQIIAIGASAGGLETLQHFFKNLPKSDINAYIIIQHLSPDFKSMMAELLEKSTHLTIKKIEDKECIKPKHIYLIPPQYNAEIIDGCFKLMAKPKGNTMNFPIDILFNSLAKYKKEKAIGIILSGTGSDGTRGLKTIKEREGLIMVQDPEEAKFDGMPRSAIKTGLADFILPVDQMGKELKHYIKNSFANPLMKYQEIEYDKEAIKKILHLVDQKTNLDFSNYKYATLSRRLIRRFQVCKCNTFQEYQDYVEKNKAELHLLAKEFLIGVTQFFRDEEVWIKLQDEIIPQVVAKIKPNETLKIWDIACSTGEEAYSIAILVNEEIEHQEKNVKVKIFATDVSQDFLNIASTGIYPESIAAEMDPYLLNKYFTHTHQGYRVVEKIRNHVIFSQHNLLKNPPFGQMEMVFCRNLLIYFQNKIQNQSLDILHFCLNKEGYLVLGTSETLHSHNEHFKYVDRKLRIFQNQNPTERLQNTQSLRNNTQKMIKNTPKNDTVSIQQSPRNKTKNNLQFLDLFNELILEQFNSAAVYIDEEFTILQGIGDFKRYAQLPEKGFSVNLLDMLSDSLKKLVKSGVYKARKTAEKQLFSQLKIGDLSEDKTVKLIIKPIENLVGNSSTHFIICFAEEDYDKNQKATRIEVSNQSIEQEYIKQLEEELKDVKLELQTSLTNLETSNEELQAANEELLASNEELQSTNEELQSVNEEINTVNAENIQKVDDLEQLNSDMNNLLESTNIGTIFLDKELCIRKFTPAINKHFNFIDSDLGRPIEHFTGAFNKRTKNKIVEKCKRVLKNGGIIEKKILTQDGINYLQRVSPFFDSNGSKNGVVITYINIESLEEAKRKLMLSEKRFKSFYEEDPVMHFSVDPITSKIIHCNQEAAETLEFASKEDLKNINFFNLYKNKQQLKALKFEKLFKEESELKNVELEMCSKTGKTIPIMLNFTVEYDEFDKPTLNRFTCIDITELKKTQKALSKQKKNLERTNKDLEQFVSICSHDLQEPLATIKFASDVINKVYAKELDEKAKTYITYIDQACDRLSEQIKALLEHSRIGRDSEKKLIDTQELVEVVKYDLGKRIKETKAKVFVGDLPKIRGYEVELRLLFQNLLSNAIKYKDKNRDPEIRISSYPDGKYRVFSITDNGIGIPKENQKQIFDIFNRVPTEEKYEGTGVGLAHVEKIISLHKGSIWVDSQPGAGSTFYFKLKEK
jgi:two-component system CheB/CheR fusion protein